MTIYFNQLVSCTQCGFSTRDIALMSAHSCDVQDNGGRCEDYPCCGHEWGDCNGLKHGSDQAIQSDPHLLCDHEAGICDTWDEDEEEGE